MPWGRLDDSLYDHPKVEDLPDSIRNSCVGVWARAISWSNRYLTDGLVPLSKLRRLDATAREIDALLGVGLFEREDDAIRIHDFLEFNDSAEDVRRRRAEMKELGRRGGKRSAEARRSTDAVKHDAQPDGERNGAAPRSSGTVKRDAQAQRPTAPREPARVNPRPDPSESRPVESRGSSTDELRAREAQPSSALADVLG